MPIIKGPFTIKWGDNTILDVEDVDLEYTHDSEEFTTLQGATRTIDGSIKAMATITLLASDIPALAALLPQHFVANGGVLSTGETVDDANGAIDIVPRSCDVDEVFNHLTIESCANPGTVMRLVNARTRYESTEYSDKVQKVSVTFIGEPANADAILQYFEAGSIATVS